MGALFAEIGEGNFETRPPNPLLLPEPSSDADCGLLNFLCRSIALRRDRQCTVLWPVEVSLQKHRFETRSTMHAPPIEKILSRVFQLKIRSEEVKSRVFACGKIARYIYIWTKSVSVFDGPSVLFGCLVSWLGLYKAQREIKLHIEQAAEEIEQTMQRREIIIIEHITYEIYRETENIHVNFVVCSYYSIITCINFYSRSLYCSFIL